MFTLIHQLSPSTLLLLLAVAAIFLSLVFLPWLHAKHHGAAAPPHRLVAWCRRSASARRDILLAGGLALKFTSSWGASFGSGVGTGLLDRVSCASCFLIAALWIALLFRLTFSLGGRVEGDSPQADAADDAGTPAPAKRLVGLSMMSHLADVLDFVR